MASFPCQMQPLLPQLVSHRSNGAHPHSLRRFAASSVVLALLLVAAVALSSSSVSSSLEAHVDALPTDAQMKSAEAPVSQASPASHASHLKRLSPKTIVSEGSAYVNAFSGRGSIGKRSHEDFGKITMEMIKKLDKELPSISNHQSSSHVPAEHWSDEQPHVNSHPVKLSQRV